MVKEEPVTPKRKHESQHQDMDEEQPPKRVKEEHTITKLSDIEHVLHASDMYIGQAPHSASPAVTRFIYDRDLQRMQYRSVQYPHGLLKVFDEALVNAADNATRGTTMIKVGVDRTRNAVWIYNNGENFPIQPTIHPSRADDKEFAYQPELAFFHCKSSSAYTKTKRVTGGKYGLGAKLISIFSHWSEVEMCDGEWYYFQRSEDHMRTLHKPVIRRAKGNERGKPFLSLYFSPDLSFFYPTSSPVPTTFPDDVLQLFMTRALDIAGTLPSSVSVCWSIDLDQAPSPSSIKYTRLHTKGFKEFGKLFIPQDVQVDHIAHFQSERWEVLMIKNPLPYAVNVSFVNNINTYMGGEHVKHVQQQILQFCRKKVDQVDLRRVSNAVMIFVNATIEDPSYTSQIKEQLVSSPDTFGSTCELTDKFLNHLNRNGVIEGLKKEMEDKEMAGIKRQIGAGKIKDISNIPHFRDANWAGTRRSKQTVIMFFEGVSALQLGEQAVVALGSDVCGIMAVKGKILNVDTKPKKMADNEEFANICRVLGLTPGEKTPIDRLRYGKVILVTDADGDGSHIRGLFLYMFSHLWPHLLEEPQFLSMMITPIVVASRPKQALPFYTIQSFEKWYDQLPETEQKRWNVKYYKGLGTSTSAEGRKYFNDLRLHLCHFQPAQPEDHQLLEHTFGKANAKRRKEWLSTYNREDYMPYGQTREISIKDFIHKDLKHFSISSVRRGIPSCEDGLTPAARKCVWVGLKKKIDHEVKVSSLQSTVAENTSYHHGADSLGQTIVGMGQTFPGSQNVNIYMPNGQFGMRTDGGNVSAATRYLFTKVNPIARHIFRAEDDDLLVAQTDEGQVIEPRTLSPIIPFALCNGFTGMSTGFAADVPAYRPEDLIAQTRRAIRGEPLVDFQPWYHHFKGAITSDAKGCFTSTGLVNKVSDTVYHVVELPICVWRNTYKATLTKMKEATTIASFEEKHGEKLNDKKVKRKSVDEDEKVDENDICFIVTLPKPLEPGVDVVSFFNLSRKYSSQLNLIIDREEVRIRTFTSISDIFQHWYEYRLKMYDTRRLYLKQQLIDSVPLLDARAVFLQAIVDGRLAMGLTRSVMVEHMMALGLKEEFHESLLRMRIYNCTAENLAKVKEEKETCLERITYYDTVLPTALWEQDLNELEQALVVHWATR